MAQRKLAGCPQYMAGYINAVCWVPYGIVVMVGWTEEKKEMARKINEENNIDNA